MADGWLQPYSRQIRDRQRLFDLKMKRINQRAGSLEEYARGYRYYGFNRDAETGAWTYREWAPAARRVSLIGILTAGTGRATRWSGMSAACGKLRCRLMRWPTGRR